MTEDEFDQATGAIYDENDLPPGLPEPSNGVTYFGSEQLHELQTFCQDFPQYHIITQVDGDNGECMYVNSIAYVNRNYYLIGNGSKDEDLNCIWDGYEVGGDHNPIEDDEE